MLIDAGALVNAVNISGTTALIQAAHFGHVDAVALLLESDVDPDFANVKGTTALMRSAQEGNDRICSMLISSKKGVDVNRTNLEGMNALMLASQRGHADTVRVLVHAGAVMDDITTQGSTALALACKRGHEEVVKVLVSMGAEICIRDARGRTAADIALKYGNENILKWLNTQVQKQMVRETKCYQRAHELSLFREAYLMNKLQLSSMAAQVMTIYKAKKVESLTAIAKGVGNSKLPTDRISTDLAENLNIRDNVPNATLRNGVIDMGCQHTSSLVVNRNYPWEEWYWIIVLHRYSYVLLYFFSVL